MSWESPQQRGWTDGGAADAWFERNKTRLSPTLPPTKTQKLFASRIRPGQRVLEIGTANGFQLRILREQVQCEAYGIDPSPVAIADGKVRYPDLNLSVGTADKLEFPDQSFDVVIFGACLCLVDRTRLMRAVAEADRVLRPEGHLIIADFDPAVPHRRRFKHQDGLWTYKMHYADLWLANPCYALAEKVSFSHEGEGFHTDPNERMAAWVLVKCVEQAYLELP
jgi:ubiquinone/menaquinone biosynthesis C-methylase UbiE